jgi:hypothetical protein
MKDFKITMCLLVAAIFFFSCKEKKKMTSEKDVTVNNASQELQTDNTCEFHKMSIPYHSDIFSKVDGINTTCLAGNDLYLVSKYAKKFFVINITSNSLSECPKLNHLADSLYRIYSYPNRLYIDSNNIFVGFENGLVCLNKNFQIKYTLQATPKYDHFEAFPSDKLAIFAGDTIKVYRKNDGLLLKKYKSDLSGVDFIKSNTGTYAEFNTFLKLSSDKDSIKVDSEFTPRKIDGFNPMQDGYPAYVTKNYILWFAYGKRNTMLVMNNQINKIIKTIPFGKFDLLTDHEDQINANEHYLDYSIELQGDKFYIISFRNHNLSVFQGCLGIKF